MNKIEESIYQVHNIDNKKNSNYFFNTVHPLIKLALSIIYILLLTSIDKYNLTTTLAMSIYPIIVSILGNLSIKDCLKRLKIVLILLLVIGIANPILDRSIITYIGNIPINAGMLSAITLILKGVFAIISSYFLMVTTRIEKICYALKILHVPNIIITIVMLIYRYIVVFLKEVQRIWTAYTLRAPNQKGIHYTVWGSVLGRLMISSIDRAELVYESMELRGFSSDTFLGEKQELNIVSIVFFVLILLLLIIIRFLPIFEIIGDVFV